MKKIYKLSFGTLILLLNFNIVISQEKLSKNHLKKGEILDVLFISQKQDTDSLFKDYVRVAFPLAIEMSYKSLTSHRVIAATQGNIEPQYLVLAKWKNKELREQFINDIEDHVPDFHQRRRDIWSIFNLTYYEITEDVSFGFDKSKFYVISAYWKKDDNEFDDFIDRFNTAISSSNGHHILELKTGISPFMYYYQPNYCVITEWDNKDDFNHFYKKSLQIDTNGLLHVNQFIIQ